MQYLTEILTILFVFVSIVQCGRFDNPRNINLYARPAPSINPQQSAQGYGQSSYPGNQYQSQHQVAQQHAGLHQQRVQHNQQYPQQQQNQFYNSNHHRQQQFNHPRTLESQFKQPQFAKDYLKEDELNDNNRAHADTRVKDLGDGRHQEVTFTNSHQVDDNGSYDSGHLSSQTTAISDPRSSRQGVIKSSNLRKNKSNDYSSVEEGNKGGPFYLNSLNMAEHREKELTKDYQRVHERNRVSSNAIKSSKSKTNIKSTFRNKKSTTLSKVKAKSDGTANLASQLPVIASGGASIGSDGSISTESRGLFGSSSSSYKQPSNYRIA